MSGASKRPYSYSYAKAVSRSETDLRWRKARHCRKRPFLFSCGHQYGSGASFCWLRNPMQVLVRHRFVTKEKLGVPLTRVERSITRILLQSPAVPARGTMALSGRSRFKTLEINSLTVIPRWPQSLRFRLV